MSLVTQQLEASLALTPEEEAYNQCRDTALHWPPLSRADRIAANLNKTTYLLHSTDEHGQITINETLVGRSREQVATDIADGEVSDVVEVREAVIDEPLRDVTADIAEMVERKLLADDDAWRGDPLLTYERIAYDEFFNRHLPGLIDEFKHRAAPYSCESREDYMRGDR